MLNKHRRTLALLLSLCAALTLAGCRKTSPQGANASAEAPLPSEHSIAAAASAPADSPAPPSPSSLPSAPDLSAPVSSEDAGENYRTFPPEGTPLPTIPVSDAREDADAPALSGLKEEIDRQIQASGRSCVWDVWVEYLPDAGSLHCTNNEDGSPMVSASIIKLFIMAAVFEQVEQGKLSESDIEDELRSMITISDNTSANDLTCLLGGGSAEEGMEAVNAYAFEIGCADTHMNRLMLVNNGLQNYTSAKDCAVLLGMIYRGECVSADASEKMLDLLKAQQRTAKIPAGVPEGVVTANKTGELTGLSECDVAIVFAEKSPYILCALSQPDDNSAAAVRITEISRAVYDYITDGA